MRRKVTFSFSILVLLLLSIPLHTIAQKKQKKKKPLRDTLDNAIDISYYLNNLHGFLPVIAPITEPAVGYGAALAGAFFIPKKTTKKKFKMPDVAGVAGGITSNKTWFAGAGYMGFWKDDRIRYRGVLGYADIRLKYYGVSGNLLEDKSAEFRLKSYFLLQQALFRIGSSRFLLGGRYLFMKTTAIFFEESDIPIINPKDIDFTNSGIGLIAEYENFNNIFSPTKGLRINVTYSQYLELLGSDRDFGRLSFFLYYYLPVFLHRWTAGFRLDTQMATGDPPFYMKPFIALRGVPAMRYQGNYTTLIETEQEVMLTKRWSVVAFGGYGAAFKSFEEVADASNAWNAGAGFRYLIARMFGLKMGMDLARGPDQWAVYVVIGSAWAR
ncbi:MAG: BamA/TamA family outer membrane protein [Bacteroidales bacterium]|nr:BamA/TamA family outer membrane protein [Bacteroidales bacterium]